VSVDCALQASSVTTVLQGCYIETKFVALQYCYTETLCLYAAMPCATVTTNRNQDIWGRNPSPFRHCS